MNTPISPEILAILNHTDNLHLREYRKKYKDHPFRANALDVLAAIKLRIIALLAGNDIKHSYQRRNKWDKRWIIGVLQSYRLQVLISEGSGRKIPFWDGYSLQVIDREIAPLIFALNKKGIKTTFSCEGQKDNIKGHSCVPYFTTLGKNFPTEILTMLDEANVPYQFSEPNDIFKTKALHGHDYKDREPFLKVVNLWAANNGYPDINILKNEWKKY